MLRERKDYNNTVMYKLSHKDCDDNNNFIYVGHTTHFIERKANHKSCCNNENYKLHNNTLYKYIRENGGWENWDMILIENYPCTGIREAEEREEYWRLYFNAKLNKKKCFLTDAQLLNYGMDYYENNKEKFKDYYENNKEKNKHKMSIYYTCNICNCGFRTNEISRHSRTKKHIKNIILNNEENYI